MIIGVFYIDFEHAKDIFQICKWLQGSMEKNMVFAPASMVFRGKWENPKFRVQGWSASKVRWCTGSGCLKYSNNNIKVIITGLSRTSYFDDV